MWYNLRLGTARITAVDRPGEKAKKIQTKQ
jgi:hypothetical protein